MLLCASMALGVRAAVEPIELARPTFVADSWGNLTCQTVSTDGLYRWQFDMRESSGEIVSGKTYKLGQELSAGYSYGFYTQDSIIRIEYQRAEFTYTRDENGLEYIDAYVKGGNQLMGVHEWQLHYQTHEIPSVQPDTVYLTVPFAEMSDYTRTYENFRFEGDCAGYHVSVTINSKQLVGEYDWSQAAAIGTEVQNLHDGTRYPMEDVHVTVVETEKGYKLTGVLTPYQQWEGQVLVYAVELDYKPKPVFTKVFVPAVDYDWAVVDGALHVQLYPQGEEMPTYEFVVQTTKMEELHRYTMLRGEVQADYYDADIRAFHNKEIGDIYCIEANAWEYGEEDGNPNYQYIINYVGVEKPLETAIESVQTSAPKKVYLIIEDGQLQVVVDDTRYTLSGQIIQ